MTSVAPYTLAYDGENRLATASSAANGSATYDYDGEGRRVRAMVGAVETVYAYTADGELAAEYTTQATTGTGTRYVTTDALGSTRAVTDDAGSVASRHDYAPFGEELPVGLGGRTAALSYGAAGPRVRFTGKERDQINGGDTGLDYFGARYYSGAHGRFTSPDPPQDQEPLFPQSWNLYSYVRNRLSSFIDPNGRLHLYSESLRPDRESRSVLYLEAGAAERRKIDPGIALISPIKPEAHSMTSHL